MIRSSGEGEDRQLESVECRHLQQRGIGPAFRDGGAVKPVEVVTDEDIISVHPFDELAVRPFEPHAFRAFPEPFLALTAGGHGVEDAVLAKLDVEEGKWQGRSPGNGDCRLFAGL